MAASTIAALAAAALLLTGCDSTAKPVADVTTDRAESAFYYQVSEADSTGTVLGNRERVIDIGHSVCHDMRDRGKTAGNQIDALRGSGASEDDVEVFRKLILAAVEYLCPDQKDRL